MLAPLQEGRIWTKQNLALWLGEALLVILVALAGLAYCFPLAFSQAETHIWSHTADPYALGDLGGALYMTVRSALGEVGCTATTHGVPWSYDLCSEIPNPVVTDMLGGSVARYGMPYGYNLGVVALLVSNGAAVYLATRLFGSSVWWALVGAMVATTAPSVVYEVEGGYVQHVWWAPAIAGFALSLASVRSWRLLSLSILGGLLLAYSIPVYAMIPFMLLPWALMAGVVELRGGHVDGIAESSAVWRENLKRAVVGALIAVICVLPQISSGLESAGPRLFEGSVNSSNLMLGLEAFTTDDWFGMGVSGEELVRSPGLLVWALVVFSALGWRRAARFMPALLGGMLMLGISLGPSIAGEYRDWLPYVFMMEHVEIARGSMRPTRYGVAAVMLFSVAMPIAASAACERIRKPFLPVKKVMALSLAWFLILQIRPASVSQSLSWPPLPDVPNLEDDPINSEEVWLDLPVVGRGENRFAQWAYNPAPRMNPPHDIGQWRDQVRHSDFVLIDSLMAIGRGQEPEAAWLRALQVRVPEVVDQSLSQVVIHRGARSPSAERGWIEVLELAGAERIVANERVFVFRF